MRKNMNSPKEIAHNFIDVGVAKTSMSNFKLLILGILAGMFIALAGIGSTIASLTVENGRLLNAMIFPAGLAMVIVAGSELFTGNSLIIVSVLEKKVKLSKMLNNWLIVYLGNLIGSVIVALLVVYGHVPDLFNQTLAVTMVNGANAKLSLTFSEAFIRGILCNILVCIAVWMAAASNKISGKIIALYFPILLFVICGFEHCVANMFCVPAGIFVSSEYGIAAQGLNWINFMIKNLIPVTLGNIVGGCLVGFSYWLVYKKNK